MKEVIDRDSLFGQNYYWQRQSLLLKVLLTCTNVLLFTKPLIALVEIVSLDKDFFLTETVFLMIIIFTETFPLDENTIDRDSLFEW